MHTTNNPEQIQVFFEIAISIGSSLDLKKMVKSSILTYLRKLNCSSGAVFQYNETENNQIIFNKVIAIPYSADIKTEFEIIADLIDKPIDKAKLNELIPQLPLKSTLKNGSHSYLMNLPGFGLLCLNKNSDEFTQNILYTLKPINNKLAQACVACIKNRDLSVAKEKAIESDRLKTAFIENISHEIRTPLNAIVGYSSLIADNQITQAMLPTACKTIVRSSNNLLSLMENLMDVSILQTGAITLKYNLININQLLINLKDSFNKHVIIEQKEHLSLRIDIPENDVTFVSDIIRLNQIFDNLISNAVRFSEEGEIVAGYQSPRINSSGHIEELIFFVKDQGIGLSPKKLETAFKPFNRIENNGDKLYSGTGIGLTICKRLIELLDGEIWIESTENEYTTVFFKVRANKKVNELVSRL